MENILVIIRGNSASGKTFLSNKIQKHYGYDNCLLLHQDVIRRDILHANDHQNTPAIKLIDNLIAYGLSNYPITIVEGILRRDVYGDMLNKIIKSRVPNSLVYYLDVPFETTVKYDKTKPEPFGKETLKSWWRSNDYLGDNDRLLNNGETMTFLPRVISDIKEYIKI